MSARIIIKSKIDTTEIEFDRAQLLAASPTIAATVSSDATASIVEVNIAGRHIGYIKSYIEHHGSNETPAPVGPAQNKWTTASPFVDTWDAEYFKRVQVEEKDPMLHEFTTAVEYTGMETFLKKTTLAIVLNIMSRSSIDSDRLVEDIAKLLQSKTS